MADAKGATTAINISISALALLELKLVLASSSKMITWSFQVFFFSYPRRF